MRLFISIAIALSLVVPCTASGQEMWVWGSDTQGMDLATRIAMGQVSTGGVQWKQIYKFGKNPDVDGGEEDVWDCPELSGQAAETTYPFQTAAFTLNVSSDNAADATLPITVIGHDSTGAEQTVVGALGAAAAVSGTVYTQVGTASNWTRVYRAFNSGTTAYTGEIYLHIDAADTGDDGVPDASTDIMACILDGQTQMAIYTVPLGFRALILASQAGINPGISAVARSVDTHIMTLEHATVASSTSAWRIREHIGLQNTGTGQMSTQYNVLRVLPALTDIKIRSDAPSAASEIAGAFELRLIPNAAFKD